MLVMTFPKPKESRSEDFFDRRFFELMCQFLYSKFFWKKRAARRELCRIYVDKFRRTFEKRGGIKILSAVDLVKEYETIEKAGRVFVIEFFNLIMEEEVRRNG